MTGGIAQTGFTPARAVVVGGGLAGLAAAVRLSDAGLAVTLLESRARLGGATHSFERTLHTDREGDEPERIIVDNGQHVFLRCCTAYREFLRRLGVEGDTHLQGRLDVPVVAPEPGGHVRQARLHRDPLPAPLHLARSLLGYRLLSPSQRLRAIRGALAMRGIDRHDPAVDAQSFAQWLRDHGQTDEIIERLWDVVTVATLNASARDASLTLAAMVYQTGLLEHADAADVGLPAVPLGRLHGDAAATVLRGAGAKVLLRQRVRAVRQQDAGFTVESDDATHEADVVVVAVPHDAAGRLLPPGASDAIARAADLGMSPILNVHVVYDHAVMSEPFTAAVGTPAQWIFDRTAPSGLHRGQYLAVSVSAADSYIDRPVAALRETFLPELARLLPAARTAGVRDFFVTRERTATFRQGPRSRALRPDHRSGIPGLAIAGAWTDTGWPATMEGAVRSGVSAAAAAIAELAARRGTPTGAPGPDRVTDPAGSSADEEEVA